MKKPFIICIITAIVLFAVVNGLGNWVLKKGLSEYYCLQPADVLVIGHSMSEMGIDRNGLEAVSGCTIAKYCMNGAGTADRFVMIKHYIEATGHKPKLVIYDVSGRSFSSGLATNSYALFYPFMDESKAVSEYIRENAVAEDYWRKKLIPLTRYDDTRLGAVIRGYRHNWSNMTLKRFEPGAFQKQLDTGNFWKISMNEDNMRLFDETLAFLQTQGIRCLLLALPCVDMLNNAEPEKYAAAMEYIRKEVDKYPLVTFCDMNPEFSHNYELFADPIHLNPKGQNAVTEWLVKHLKNEL